MASERPDLRDIAAWWEIQKAIRAALCRDDAAPLWHRTTTDAVWVLGTPFRVTLEPLGANGDGRWYENEAADTPKEEA